MLLLFIVSFIYLFSTFLQIFHDSATFFMWNPRQISEEGKMGDGDFDCLPKVLERVLYSPNQKEVTDLVRDTDVTKSYAELFISRMKQ